MKAFLILALAASSFFSIAQASDDKKKASAIDPDKKYPTAWYYKPGFVISPYKPYNVLEVKHLKPGDYAYDPFTAIINPSTNKREISTAKIFKIPAPPKKKPATAEKPAN